MLIPLSTIVLRANNGACSVKQQPAYFAKVYAVLWRRKLLDEKGIEVLPLPDITPEAMRYTEVADVAQAERLLLTYFGNTTSTKDPENDKNTRQARDLVQMVFPNGLREEITQLLREDAKRMQEEAAKPKPETKPHPSFIEAGASADQALAFQNRGYPTLADIPDDFIAVCEVPGVAPGLAAKLIATKQAEAARPPAQSHPVAAAKKG